MSNRILIILLFLFSSGCLEQKEPLVLKKISVNNLRNIDVQDYYGITVSNFLSNWNFSYQEYIWLTEPPLYLSGCCFVCNDSIKIYIIADSITFQTSYNPTGNWNIDKFMKEKILSIGIHIYDKPLYKGYLIGPPPKNYFDKQNK